VGKFAAETDGSVSLKVGDTIRVIPAWTIRTVDVAYEFDNHGAIGAPLGAIAGAVLGGLLAKINKVASEGGPLGYAAAGAVVGITIGWAVTSPRTRARWLPVPWSPPEKPE
jgi:outer membrane lipoprotein SlyB